MNMSYTFSFNSLICEYHKIIHNDLQLLVKNLPVIIKQGIATIPMQLLLKMCIICDTMLQLIFEELNLANFTAIHQIHQCIYTYLHRDHPLPPHDIKPARLHHDDDNDDDDDYDDDDVDLYYNPLRKDAEETEDLPDDDAPPPLPLSHLPPPLPSRLAPSTDVMETSFNEEDRDAVCTTYKYVK